MLGPPTRRIWQGERDASALTEGLDEQDSELIERVLEMIGQYERGERELPDEALAAAPEAVRAAIIAKDNAALDVALRELSPDEAQQILIRLVRAGVLTAAPRAESDETAEEKMARLTREAENAVTQALAGGDIAQRSELAARLEEVARQAEDAEKEDSRWLALAIRLRELRDQLTQPVNQPDTEIQGLVMSS